MASDANAADASNDVVLPRRHYGQWIASALVIVLLGLFLRLIATNPNFKWDVVAEYFTADTVLRGLWMTILLTVLAVGIGLVLGVPLAVMRMSPNRLLNSVAFGYVWFFRGTPLLVQIVFWYNLSALFPVLRVGIPGGPTFWEADTNAFVTPLLAATLALGLNQAAYMGELIRGGLISVDQGQTEAATAVGMSKVQALRHIVLPQAMRVVIPPLGSETITMLKLTSLVSVVSIGDLLYSVQAVYQANYQVIPLLLVASIWYLIVVSVLSVGQYYVEKRLGRGYGQLKVKNEGRDVA